MCEKSSNISSLLILGAIVLIILVLIYFSMSRGKGKVREETTIAPGTKPKPRKEPAVISKPISKGSRPKPTPTTTSHKITLTNIKKSYQGTEILKSISLEFEEGKIYGIVGPSGCGKSRIIETIIGRVAPDSGRISVFGVDSGDMKKVNEIVGFVPQHPELYTEQTVMQNMQNSAIKWGIGVREFEGAEKILRDVELHDRKNVSAKDISGGQVKRLSLAMELLRNPQVLLLDEPTTGLDPTMRMKIMGIFEKLNRTEGKLIIFTTHYMDEIDICDEVVIMKAGEVLVKAGLDELRRRTPGRGRIVEVTLYSPIAGIARKLEADGKIEKVIESGRNLHIFTHEPNVMEIGNKISALGGVVEGSRMTQADMRDLFIYYTDEVPEDE